MLPKENRIRDDKEIRRIIRNKQIHRTSSLLELFAEPSDQNRILVICSKKFGSAVRRNRIRRVLAGLLLEKWRNSNKKFNFVFRVRGIIVNDEILEAEIARLS